MQTNTLKTNKIFNFWKISFLEAYPVQKIIINPQAEDNIALHTWRVSQNIRKSTYFLFIHLGRTAPFFNPFLSKFRNGSYLTFINLYFLSCIILFLMGRFIQSILFTVDNAIAIRKLFLKEVQIWLDLDDSSSRILLLLLYVQRQQVYPNLYLF